MHVDILGQEIRRELSIPDLTGANTDWSKIGTLDLGQISVVKDLTQYAPESFVILDDVVKPDTWVVKAMPDLYKGFPRDFAPVVELSNLTARDQTAAIKVTPALAMDMEQGRAFTSVAREIQRAFLETPGYERRWSKVHLEEIHRERRFFRGRVITSVHGEPGLRERLAIELGAFPAAGRARAADALTLASRLHAGDRRQRKPYLNHLLRVAIRILHHYRVRDTDVTCAALLHDAVEDHPADIAPGGRDDALGVLADRFGGRTAALVAAVTNPAYQPGRDEHQQYREHVTASLDASPWARVIKASDLTDNAIRVIHLTGPKLSRLARKYGPLVPVLRELILRPDTPLDADVKTMIAGQLDTTQGRFAAIWHGPDADADQR